MADEDHDQLTTTLGDELSEALERGQYLGVEIVLLDKPSDRLLGLAEQFVQIAFAPFRPVGYRNGRLRRQVVEQPRASSDTDILAFSRLSARDMITAPSHSSSSRRGRGSTALAEPMEAVNPPSLLSMSGPNIITLPFHQP
jgi:hypothetical protein